MKKLLFLVAILVVVLLLIFGSSNLKPKDGQLSVKVTSKQATVFQDNRELGQTPFFSNQLPVGGSNIRIVSDQASWDALVTLTSGTVTTVNLDLSKIDKFTSGEVLFFKPGRKSVTVVSKPEKAQIYLNNKDSGQTTKNLNLDEANSNLLIKKPGYLDRQLPITLEDNLTLFATVYLSVDPFAEIKKIDANDKITWFALANPYVDLTKSYPDWVEGIRHTQNYFTGSQTRFDVLIDPSGKDYVLNQAEWDNKLSSKAVANIGYLATKVAEAPSAAAKATWERLKSEFN